VGEGDLATLTLLDLSADFDAVKKFLYRLEVSFGVTDTVHRWFISHLSGRSQFVRCGSTSTLPKVVSFGVPEWLVLIPNLFLLYTADLIGIVQTHGLQPHIYAEDTYNIIYHSWLPSSVRHRAASEPRVSVY